MFCKNALVKTRSERLNEEQKYLQTVKSGTKHSDNLLIDSCACPWELRGRRAAAAVLGIKQDS